MPSIVKLKLLPIPNKMIEEISNTLKNLLNIQKKIQSAIEIYDDKNIDFILKNDHNYL